MRFRVRLSFLSTCAALFTLQCYGQSISGPPRLRKQGPARQLILDGKPFLALAAELGNNTTTGLENMQPVWPRLVSDNLNSALVAN